MFKTICGSCFYARLIHSKNKQAIICTVEQGAKIYRQYCPDYMNKDGIIGLEKKDCIQRVKSKGTKGDRIAT